MGLHTSESGHAIAGASRPGISEVRRCHRCPRFRDVTVVSINVHTPKDVSSRALGRRLASPSANPSQSDAGYSPACCALLSPRSSSPFATLSCGVVPCGQPAKRRKSRGPVSCLDARQQGTDGETSAGRRRARATRVQVKSSPVCRTSPDPSFLYKRRADLHARCPYRAVLDLSHANLCTS